MIFLCHYLNQWAFHHSFSFLCSVPEVSDRVALVSPWDPVRVKPSDKCNNYLGSMSIQFLQLLPWNFVAQFADKVSLAWSDGVSSRTHEALCSFGIILLYNRVGFCGIFFAIVFQTYLAQKWDNAFEIESFVNPGNNTHSHLIHPKDYNFIKL